MNRPMRGTIKQLKKFARSKVYATISDRIWAIIFLKKAWSISRIAHRCGRQRNWVYKWRDRYRRHGIQGLFDLPRSGRRPKLAQRDISRFVDRINTGATEQDEVSVLKGAYIKKLLEIEFNAKYSLSGVYAMLHRLGFSLIKPRPKHIKNDEAVMRQWKEETLPQALAEAASKHPDKTIEVWFQDEMRFGEKTRIGAEWRPSGTAWSSHTATGYRNAYVFGAVNPKTGAHCGLTTSACDTEFMSCHLNLIAQQVGDDVHMVLIMDQAGWHARSTTLIVPENISIVELPPYCPELNPIERLWLWLKENYLTNRFVKNTEDMLEIGCDLWRKVSPELVKSVCKVSYF